MVSEQGATEDECATFKAANTIAHPDFRIRIDDFEWQVHSRVLARYSKFFEKAFEGPFKVGALFTYDGSFSRSQEASDKVVILHDECPTTIAMLIDACYRGKMLPSTTSDEVRRGYNRLLPTIRDMLTVGLGSPTYDKVMKVFEERTAWQNRVLMYRASDKYQFKALLSPLRSQLSNEITQEPGLLPEIIDGIGPTVVENDPELCRRLFKSAFSKVENPRSTCDKLKLTFDPSSKALSLMEDAIFTEMAYRFQFIPADAPNKKIKRENQQAS